MSLLEALLTQTHEHAHDARAIIKDALGIVDHVKGASSKIRTDRDLSDAGRQKKVVDLVLSHPWAHLVQLRGKADAMRADIEKTRASMVPKRSDFDADDLREARAALRAAKHADRLRLAMNDDQFAAAALLAHPALSGLKRLPVAEGQPSELDLVRTNYEGRNFPERVAGLAIRERTQEAVNRAIKHVEESLCDVAGINLLEVDRLISRPGTTDLTPDDLPKVTRAEFDTFDPARQSSVMRDVREGKAVLVDA